MDIVPYGCDKIIYHRFVEWTLIGRKDLNIYDKNTKTKKCIVYYSSGSIWTNYYLLKNIRIDGQYLLYTAEKIVTVQVRI